MPDSPSQSVPRRREGAEPENPPSPKRRRVPLACRNCRERKVRCDGRRPICGTCQRRGQSEDHCEYMVIAETAKYQTERAYIQSLRDHITQLESSARQPPPSLEPSPNGNSGVEPVISSPEPAIVASHHPPEHCEHYPSPATTSLPSSISAMGAAVGDIRDTDIRDQYFGQTSIVSLVQECAHTSPSRQQTTTPLVYTAATQTADWLLDIYFTSPHMFYPWVHKQTFLTTYNSMWAARDTGHLHDLPDVGAGGRDCSTAVFYCALNAMLALGCEFSNLPSHAKRSTSLMFSERMKALISINIFDSGSLAHVQALLLVATYLQCTAYPKRCWNIVGMAYRMSIGLGLHLSRHARGLTRLEKEIRWRAWCACVHLDILVSMTMGRPAMTAPNNVPLPSPTDDRYLAEADAVPPPGEISRNQYLYENMRLIKILSNILSRIYHSAALVEADTPRRLDVDLQAVVEIDRAFDDFEASLDPALQWTSKQGSNGSADLVFKRQSNVLHARFLHLRLLLYRPAFTEYCSSASESGARGSNASGGRWIAMCRANCASGSVQAACNLIDSLSQATTQDATGAWCAGIILLLADTSGARFDGVDREARDSAWKKCVETLHRMSNVHSSARDYAIALSGLKEQKQTTLSHPPNATERGCGLRGTPWSGQHETQMLEQSRIFDGPYNILDPLMSHWDHGTEDIMLPAQFLQELDDGLLLPSLF
ncbi:fungal-specific transcription factor domain-containing protein [Aspergillus spectabilis]